MSNNTSMDKTKQADISLQARKAFDQQVDALRGDTLKRLREARNNALSHHDRSIWRSKKWLTGAGAGLAIASVLTFMIVPQLSANKLSPLDDFDILSADVDMDLVTQLDFYQWLDESINES